MGRDRIIARPPQRHPRSVVELGPSLTAQQMSLVKAFAVANPAFLNRSYHVNHRTRRRTAFRLEPQELERFAAAWAVEPVRCIQFLNAAVRRMADPSRLDRYLEASVDLEVLMDRACFPTSGERIYCGVPSYFMDGYTDMGMSSRQNALPLRQKIRVSKADLRANLLEAKRLAIFSTEPTEDLLWRYCRAIRRNLGFNDARHGGLPPASTSLAARFERAIRVGRRLAIMCQLYLQEAGIPSRLVKGNVRFFDLTGLHAWNLAFVCGRVALIDPALVDRQGPPVLTGASRSDACKLAEADGRAYLSIRDDENYYKIDVIEELTLEDLFEPRDHEAKLRSPGNRNVG